MTLTFSQPYLLLLLFLVPIVGYLAMRLRRAATRFPSKSLFTGITRGRAHVIASITMTTKLVALSLLIVAIAGPRWPDAGTRIPTEGISLGIVIDVSQSMRQEDFLWDGKAVSRLDAVKRVFRMFVEGKQGEFQSRENDLISLIVFAEVPDTVCPLTLNHGVVLQILGDQEPRVVARTNIGDAIGWALKSLDTAATKRKIMVLLTDGEHNVKEAYTPRQAAQLVAARRVPIYVIDAGKEDASGEDEQKVARAKVVKSLTDVARMTGGKYFEATNTKALIAVTQEIDRLETDKIESFVYRRYYEAYVWFALASFVLFFNVLLAEATFWRRVP